jgi:acyl carrier protein
MEKATLSETEIEERVRRIIRETFQLSPREAQGELGMGNPSSWDSLGHMGLVLEIEKEFGLTFPNFVIADLVSVPAIVRAITNDAQSS